MDDPPPTARWSSIPVWRKILIVAGALVFGGGVGALVGYWVGYFVATIMSHVMLLAAVIFIFIGPAAGFVVGVWLAFKVRSEYIDYQRATYAERNSKEYHSGRQPAAYVSTYAWRTRPYGMPEWAG